MIQRPAASGSLFGDQAPRVATESMKRAALVREIKYRKEVYPRRVASGAMSQERCDYQIWILERILAEGFRP
jgi:hypothetical protein